ncbi:MAG: hypothetical protein A3J38_00260 [Gammaproteobacteria bacterium RIFCSPHIGHO2_12_FULL_45_9]|nr:MAG: hypothetical protein A3J38_00260 [Gammaproteobacteria bacterium RIFCSPHIGHO2_12_FULL_45_9]
MSKEQANKHCLDDKALRHTANLARLQITDVELASLADKLTRIVEMADTLQTVPTQGLEPLLYPLDGLSQPMRPDVVTELNQREAYQQIALQTELGLYLVPRVIE